MQHNDSEKKPRSPLQALGSTPLRRNIMLLLLLAGTYLLLPRLGGATHSLQLLVQADGRYLLAALALQIVSLLCIAYLVHQAVPAFGPALDFGCVLQVIMASQFTSMFIPSAGLSGLALRVRYFGERGCQVETALASYALEGLGHGLAIAVTVTLVLLSLTLTGQGAPWWILALLLAPMLLGLAVLAIALGQPQSDDWRYAVLDRVNKVLARLGRRPLEAAPLQQRLDQVRQAVRALSGPRRLRLLVASMGRILSDILCLQMTLLAFGQAVRLSMTTLGYTLSSVLAYLSALPGGLFVTESSLSAILAREAVPAAVAVAATLTYRLFAFWLPRVVGLLSLLNLQRQSSRPLW